MILLALFILPLAYLLGSIPSGILISRFYDLEDPRTRGSKNIGSTNVLRSGHKGAALLTFLGDALKGSLSVGIALFLAPSLAPLAGILAVLGHIFPMWLGFKGGKGVATAFGVLAVLNLSIALLCLITWGSFFVATRYSSLASLISALAAPIYAIFLGDPTLTKVGLVLAILIVWTHRQNIGRLLKGEEHHIGNLKPPRSS